MSIKEILARGVARAVGELYGITVDPAAVQLSDVAKGFEGDVAVVVFPFVKAARKAPEAVGNEIGSWLADNEPSAAFRLSKDS